MLAQHHPDRFVLQGLIVDQLVDPVITVDAQQRILLTNSATTSLFGYGDDELTHMRLDELLPERFRADHTRGFDRYVASAGQQRQLSGYVDVVGLTQQGAEIPLSLSMTCLRHGDEILVTGVLRDMSALRTAQRTIAQKLAELEQANASLSRLADSDPLTGALNRRAMKRIGESLQASGRPYCAVLCDVDFFKAYNDRYGHLVGDTALTTVARHLTTSAPQAHVVRFGGEEFLLLLPETTGEQGLAAAEQARESLQLLGVEHAASAVASVLTLSLGVSSSTDSPKGFEQLLRQADDALYVAKRSRNRCVAWSAMLAQ